MKLNKLGFQISKNDHKFDQSNWIEFLIDGESLSTLLETRHKSIPFCYFEKDLPSYYEYHLGKEIYYLAVCNCGIASCGSITCVLDKKEDFVTFQSISIGSRKFSEEFRFTRENYDLEIKKILKVVKNNEETNHK